MVRYIIIGLFLTLVFFSKYGDYQQEKKFHAENFRKEIVKIEEGRGTKVYLDDGDYFFMSSYNGPDLAEGDILVKTGKTIIIRRRIIDGSLTGFSVAPPDTYLEYFF